MKCISILGLGLMGGSLAMALKARGFQGAIKAHARRADACAEAVRRGVVDYAFVDPAQAVDDAELVVVCTPILSIPALLGRCKTHLRRSCLLTDVGSTKAQMTVAVLRELEGREVTFIGSHPIAGSEQQGLGAARADLYEGAVVVVTTPGGQPCARLEDVKAFWTGLGAVVEVMSPEEHDQMMARTSHLPHLAAALVAGTVGRDGDPEVVGRFCGPGYRDSTRIAEGSPEVWSDIVQTNQQALLEELSAYKGRLDELIQRIERGEATEIRAFLEESRTRRQAVMARRSMEGNQELI